MMKDVTKKQLRYIWQSLNAYEVLRLISAEEVAAVRQFRGIFPGLKHKEKELRDVTNWLKDKGLVFSSLSTAETKKITLAELEEHVTTLEEELLGHNLDPLTMRYLLLFITKKSSLFTYFTEKKRGKTKVSKYA